ncbi:MAG: hypothetical protein PHQ42_01945 [Patescibacteria group bacterium]|nr:hypothetical protein [Patescibacteria group bacterium]
MASCEKTTANFAGDDQMQAASSTTEKSGFDPEEDFGKNQPHINPTGFKYCGDVGLATEVWPR